MVKNSIVSVIIGGMLLALGYGDMQGAAAAAAAGAVRAFFAAARPFGAPTVATGVGLTIGANALLAHADDRRKAAGAEGVSASAEVRQLEDMGRTLRVGGAAVAISGAFFLSPFITSGCCAAAVGSGLLPRVGQEPAAPAVSVASAAQAQGKPVQ